MGRIVSRRVSEAVAGWSLASGCELQQLEQRLRQSGREPPVELGAWLSEFNEVEGLQLAFRLALSDYRPESFRLLVLQCLAVSLLDST